LAFQQAFTTYVNQHYPAGKVSVHTKLDDDTLHGDLDFVVLVEDHEFQPKNRWNGKWRSEWMITKSQQADNQGILVQGGSKVHVHYYEDSNVQLVTKRMFDQVKLEKVNLESEDAEIAAEVVKHIKAAENKYQQALRDNYVLMNDTTFKALRRALPMNRTKFNWDQISNFRVGKEITEKQQNQF